MNEENTQFGEGELVYFTAGEYSDFGIICVARVLRTFDLSAYRRKNRYGDQVVNLDRLTAEGVVEELQAREIWMGK